MKFKDFDETHKCIETGHRVFWVHNDYSHYSDYRVYYNGKKLKYADSLIKMQNKWRIQSKENQNLRKKFIHLNILALLWLIKVMIMVKVTTNLMVLM